MSFFLFLYISPFPGNSGYIRERHMFKPWTMFTSFLEDGAAGVLQKKSTCGFLRTHQCSWSGIVIIYLLICMGTCTLPHGCRGFWRGNSSPRSRWAISPVPECLESFCSQDWSEHFPALCFAWCLLVEHFPALCFAWCLLVAGEVKIPEMCFLLQECLRSCTEEKP